MSLLMILCEHIVCFLKTSLELARVSFRLSKHNNWGMFTLYTQVIVCVYAHICTYTELAISVLLSVLDIKKKI